MQRHIRELCARDIPLIVGYFHNADAAFLKGMGVDPCKLPGFDAWCNLIREDLEKPVEDKAFFYLIWEIEGAPAGHSNINKIVHGKEAYMHLHLWRHQARRGGNGEWLARASIPRYFEAFALERLYCEPYALNPAPNRILEKAGFDLMKSYETIPGWINFHQPVNRWVLSKEKYTRLYRPGSAQEC